MIDKLYFHDTKEICMLQYEKYMLSLKIEYLDSTTSRLNERCGRYEANQPCSNYEGKKEVINIYYNTQ